METTNNSLSERKKKKRKRETDTERRKENKKGKEFGEVYGTHSITLPKRHWAEKKTQLKL